MPGEKAAMVTLEHFLGRRLKLYESRNDPAKPQALSGLSPYLHFGQISGHRCAMEAKKYSRAAPKAVEGFFEELVVRRELAVGASVHLFTLVSFRVKAALDTETHTRGLRLRAVQIQIRHRRGEGRNSVDRLKTAAAAAAASNRGVVMVVV